MLAELKEKAQAVAQSRQVSIPVSAELYRGRFYRTAQVDYGVTLDDLLRGTVTPPPAGARVDIHFEGELQGAKLQGRLQGIDYLVIRADGRCDLNMHATITTDDGARIAFWADGIFVPPADDSGIAQIRENVRLTTAHAEYQWVNQLQVWITGTIHLAREEIRVTAYVA